MASASYLAAIPLLLLAHALGFVALAPALAIIAAVLVVNAGLYLLFRTGANLRFADPSLTWLADHRGDNDGDGCPPTRSTTIAGRR